MRLFFAATLLFFGLLARAAEVLPAAIDIDPSQYWYIQSSIILHAVIADGCEGMATMDHGRVFLSALERLNRTSESSPQRQRLRRG
jgi:hypothetical protein